MNGRVATLAAVSIAMGACHAADRVTTPGGELAIGTWGGDGAGMIVIDTLTHIHIGCTFGDIQARVKLDANGHFTYDGTYVLQAYPIMVGPTLPAQFSGQLNGSVLTLAVAVDDTTAHKVVSLGPVTVQYGKEPQLGPCPICTVPGSRLREAVVLRR